MKKIFFLPVILFTAALFVSCEQDSLNPLPVKVAGNYVALDVEQSVMDFNDMSNAAFKGTFRTPGEGNQIVKYELYVRRRNPNNINSGDFILIETFTSFPAQVNITPAKVAEVLGLQVSDLQRGDIYRFIGYSYDAAGKRTGYNNLSGILKTTETMKQGYKFSSTLDFITPDLPFNYYQSFSL